MGVRWELYFPQPWSHDCHLTVTCIYLYKHYDSAYTRSFTNRMSDVNNWMGEYTNVM